MRCAWCSSQFAGRADARYCSGRCRVAAHRAQPPSELVALRRWIRHEAKVPKRVYGGNASSTNPATWASYDSARGSSVGDGLGFVFAGDGIAGIDLDGCLSDSGLEPWAAEIVNACLGTYIEVSPSGRGLHIFGLGTVGAGRRLGPIEVYDRARYFTVTMRRYRRAPLVLRDVQPCINLLLGDHNPVGLAPRAA